MEIAFIVLAGYLLISFYFAGYFAASLGGTLKSNIRAFIWGMGWPATLLWLYLSD